MTFEFYLGITRPKWLERLDVPMFISRRTLSPVKNLPRAQVRWALDSGGFTEIHSGGWGLSAAEYAVEVRRFASEIGGMDWAAPQDWMCEASALRATGLTVTEHQTNTTANFLDLRQELGCLVIPVLQGWERDDYLRHVDAYEAAGVTLADEERIGVGSVCRRNADPAIGAVLRCLQPLRLHAFGVKGSALAKYYDWMTSADSMAWSSRARWEKIRLPGCTHGQHNCEQCPRWALRWREKTLRSLDQQRLFAPG